MSSFLPLPDGTVAGAVAADPATGYQLERGGDRGYVLISGFTQSAFVVTEDGVVLIDAPPALEDKLRAAIASVTRQPVRHVIYTHAHVTHIGAVTRFGDTVRYAHEECARLLVQHRDPARPVPHERVDGPLNVLDIGGEQIHLIYAGSNHEAGNVLVWLPQQRLCVMSDVVAPGWAPYRAWGNADYPPGMLAAHDAILATDFDVYTGGHGYRCGTRGDVEQSRELLIDLITTTKRYMGEISYGKASTEVEQGNVWAAQALWIDRIGDAVMAELVTRWANTIAGMDAFTKDNVGCMAVSLAADGPVNFP